ncbi:MAG: hypothetical protein ABIN80_12960 [Dyadobacter sp.]
MGISYIKSVSADSALGLWHMTEPWQQLRNIVHLPPNELITLEEKKTDR